MPHLPLDKVKLMTQLYNCTFDDLVDAFSPDEPMTEDDTATAIKIEQRIAAAS